jgi:hypothetical protein
MELSSKHILFEDLQKQKHFQTPVSHYVNQTSINY